MHERLEKLEAARAGPAAIVCSILPRRRTRLRRSQATRLGLAPRKRTARGGGDGRKAVWPRPRLGPRVQPRTAEVRRRETDLPDRSLPRQGNRPEHHGVPFRQRDLRTALESHHIDHVQITVTETLGVGHAAAITKRPARCATWCRIICSSCCRWWRWSRRRGLTPMRCARRRPRCWRRSRPRARPMRAESCAASTSAARSAIPRSRPTAGPRMSSSKAAPKPMSR